ncbi:hypothetical protein TL16_g04213 [Triparma laevis f. inornata]|uniref:Uncharacterized protein n=1 Tax=Triparma laevis f. inornata TaxID=1714386 RepID=A0A9W7E4K2_9STRA|nr:hypothetical protein TL16_g04213 [Triparma laevis f. inornata]
MLGLISFTLFFVSQLSDLTDDHVHLIEFVHLTLFLMMVFYYLVTGWIAYSSKKCLSKFGDYEEKVANFDLVECISELKACKATRAKDWWCIDAPRHLIFGDSELDKRMHLNAYLLTRHFFLVSQGLPPDLPFDYAEYIDRCSSALCVKLVQVGWRTWAGILLITMISTGVTLLIDASDGSFDQMEEMWADSAAINLNYFWAMFFLGWVLYLVNGLIWAGFERSRASLILLTAKKEAMGDNVRASRFDRSFDAGHFEEDEDNNDDEDDRSQTTDGSLYGNMLRSTVNSRDWSHGNRHSHHIQQAKDRKENTDAIRHAHMKVKNKELGKDGKLPEPTIAAVQSPPPSNRTSQVSRASRASHRSGASGSSSKHSHSMSHSHRRTHHNSSTYSGHGSTHGNDGHGDAKQHRDSLEKTVRPVSHKMCPCAYVGDEWRHCFPLKAPEFPLRTFQGVLMFFSLFLGMGLLIFFHIDPMFMAFSIIQPFVYLYLFGLQQVPFYASLRFFGPTLSKNSLVDDLVFFAQELQLEDLKFEHRHSHLSRDTHLENFYKRREMEETRAGSEGQIKGGVTPNAGVNASLNETTRKSMNNLSLFAALRLSESRMSSRVGGGSAGGVVGGGEKTAEGKGDWKNYSFNGEVDFAREGNNGLLSPLIEDKAREDGRSRSKEGNDGENILNVSGGSEGSDGFHNYHESVNLHVDPQIVQKEYATQAMLDEVCVLLNTTTTKNFVRIAVVRCALLAFFFVLFLTSTCDYKPTEKLQCTWLDII